MNRRWFYLDAFHRPHGPVSDLELDRILSHGDCYVYTEGMADWAMGSELLAQSDVAPLRAPEPPSGLDGDGRPRNRRFNARRRADRAVQELLGLARGMAADGVVAESEAHALARWIEANAEEVDVWPINVVAERLQKIYADGRVDEEERCELLDLLLAVTGEIPDAASSARRTTRLPLDDPPPLLRFADQIYVFTGKFAFGTRTACEQAVVVRGGQCAKGISQKVHVLVIGNLGNEDWAHSSHGRKIEQAVHYREAGVPIQIVSEEHWVASLRC